MILSNHKELSQPVVEKKRHFLLSFTRHTSHSALNHSLLDLKIRVPSQMKQFSSYEERSFVISWVFHRHDQWLAKKMWYHILGQSVAKVTPVENCTSFPALSAGCTHLLCVIIGSFDHLHLLSLDNLFVWFFFFFLQDFKIVARWKAFFPTGRIPFTQQLMNLTWTEATRGGRTNPWLSAWIITITPTDRVVSPHEFW